MWFLNQPSSAARTALVYITLGCLTVIWTGVWYLYMHNHPPTRQAAYYWCGGLLATGWALIMIGMALGRIGRSAQRADLPPPSLAAAVTRTPEGGVAAPAAPVASVVPAVPVTTTPPSTPKR